MSEQQKPRRLSRRDALAQFARWPAEMMAQAAPEPSFHGDMEETLAACREEVAACWHLSKGRDLTDAQQRLTACLVRLERLAQLSSPFQQEGAHLASQGYQLAGILASHQGDLTARERSCRRSVDWAHISGDPTLIVAALTKLGVTFHEDGQPLSALLIYQQAFPFLHLASPLCQSSLYMKLAATYAQLGQEYEAEQGLDLAYQTFPAPAKDDPAFLYVDCDLPSLFLWDGMTHLALSRAKGIDHLDTDQLMQAWYAFEPFGGKKPRRVISERNRLEILNRQAETAVHLGRMERCISYLAEAAHGAKELGSEKRRHEARAIYWQARERWPHERRIQELADLLI